MTTTKPQKWNFRPKTPKNGFISSTRLFLQDFDIVININGYFKKFQARFDKLLIKRIRNQKGFRYANIYDIQDRVQVASFTGKSFKWFVKYFDDQLPK